MNLDFLERYFSIMRSHPGERLMDLIRLRYYLPEGDLKERVKS